MNIRPAAVADAERLTEIYNYYIENTIVTFEEETIDTAEVKERIAGTLKAGLPWFVAETAAGKLVGYAYASKWKGRCAYKFSAETTIYLDKDEDGRGVGSRLYEILLQHLSAKGFHVVIGGIALPNPASISLHEKLGFEKVGEFRQVGFKFGEWVDVGYWQKVMS